MGSWHWRASACPMDVAHGTLHTAVQLHDALGQGIVRHADRAYIWKYGEAVLQQRFMPSVGQLVQKPVVLLLCAQRPQGCCPAGCCLSKQRGWSAAPAASGSVRPGWPVRTNSALLHPRRFLYLLLFSWLPKPLCCLFTKDTQTNNLCTCWIISHRKLGCPVRLSMH